MRADLYLYIYGDVKSRQRAKLLIESGNVLIDGAKVSKPSLEIDETSNHEIEIINKPRFVSRGGEKLAHALECFGLDINSLDCIDIGASTGGFTDCLLQHGANSVYAVDAGHSQLDPTIENDKRVHSVEKYNARYMCADDFPHLFDLAVMDVSFISQTLLHKGVFDVLKENGYFISLIKPQFECGRAALNSKGIIKKTSFHLQAIERIIDNALICGFDCIDIVSSPIEGGDGNTEFLALFRKSDKAQNLIPDIKIKKLL